MAARLSLLGLVALAAACSPGPGRAPVFADAAVRPEAGVIDAGFFDSGVNDAAVVPFDAGPPPEFPFTGVFGIVDDANPLFAREVQGQLHLVVGAFPYTYVGTIDEAGRVDVSSAELAGSGCTINGITGTYARTDALYDLQHVTCNARGETVESRLQGAFTADYDGTWSGAYAVRMEVVTDVMGCLGLGALEDPGLWSLSLLGDGSVAIFVAEDPLAAGVVYFGRARPDRTSFTALQHLDANANGPQVSMQGMMALPMNDVPASFSGRRDVFLPETACTVSVAYVAERVAAP